MQVRVKDALKLADVARTTARLSERYRGADHPKTRKLKARSDMAAHFALAVLQVARNNHAQKP
jgi:hypothetical protein